MAINNYNEFCCYPAYFNVGNEDDFEVINKIIELGDDMCMPVNITILDDTVFEGDETFIIVATYGNDSLSSTENKISATITILDDECRPLNNHSSCLIITYCNDIIMVNCRCPSDDQSSGYEC